MKEFREKVKTTKHEWLGSLAKWDQAINLAEEALEKSQRGEALRQDNSIIDADASAETALKALKQRYVFYCKFIFRPRTTVTYQQCGFVTREFQNQTSDGRLGLGRVSKGVKLS